jgi:hypothetical protein
VQAGGGEERLGTDPFTTGTASVRMQEDGRGGKVRRDRTGRVAVQECDDAEWINAGPILFSWTSHLEKRLAIELLMPRTRGTIVVKVGTMTASDGGWMTYRYLGLT